MCDEKEQSPLRFTRDEALALLSLCMLAPTPADRPAEQGLVKLARACREFLTDDADSLDFEILPQNGHS